MNTLGGKSNKLNPNNGIDDSIVASDRQQGKPICYFKNLEFKYHSNSYFVCFRKRQADRQS